MQVESTVDTEAMVRVRLIDGTYLSTIMEGEYTLDDVRAKLVARIQSWYYMVKDGVEGLALLYNVGYHFIPLSDEAEKPVLMSAEEVFNYIIA